MIDFNIKDYVRKPISVIPAGRYTFKIKKADIKATKNSKDGHDNSRMAYILLEVISDFRKGEIIFSNYNIYNSSATATEMGRVKFAELCTAVGLEIINNISQLDGLIFDAQVSEGSYNGKANNNIDSHHEPKGDYTRISESQLTAPDELNDNIPF
jgi:hypothetical protein